MKYIVTIIGLICLMACTKEETTRTAETLGSQERPIAFNDAYTVQPTTRSSEAFTATKGIPMGQSMGVYAYLHNTDTRDYSTDTPNFMWNQQATRTIGGEPFSYSPLKYWPNTESNKLSFIAYFPYTEETPGHTESPEYPTNPTGLRTLLANNATGLPTFNFTVKDNAVDQVDFLVSDVVPNLPETRDTEDDPHLPFNDLTIYDRVRFIFKHMTAKVEFRIVASEEIRKDIVSFKLTDLSVSNICKSGKLTPTYNPETSVTSFTWSYWATLHNYDFKTYVPQLLLPQTLSNDVKLNLEYEITFKSDGTTYQYDTHGKPVADQDYKYSNSATLQLNTMKLTGTDTPLNEWLPNHHYVYIIRLRANRIEFTGEVVDWGDYDDTNIIDIEER